MHIRFRTIAPLVLMATVLLAGCQTPGNKAGTASTSSSGATPSAAATPPAGAPGTSAPSTVPVASSVGFYIAQTDAAPDLMEVKLSDATVYVQRQPVLTRADLTEAAALVDRQGQNFVGLRFSPEGARKLAQVSSQNVGKLLVLVINGQLVAAPRIAEPLNRGVLAFGVDTAQTATEIAARVRGDAPAASGTGTQAVPPASNRSAPASGTANPAR
ncbi:preprotein translocase subunit SecD [Bordetella sp. H567]|uniref:SecDF P1 head subdomain-containing protein n=1 Tax=Bordetella sp. H567 TaxID=1697043 RepID=UPI00081C416B|nr:preprotein translocase subunit SecD [Bordetella sp. H567]AOB32884.1 preprotein translocase subunit SecD [Bordetella sp. H567]